MFNPKFWLFRHLRQLSLALVLCLVVSYGALLLVSIPVVAYFDQMRALENPSQILDESSAAGNISSLTHKSEQKSHVQKESWGLRNSLRVILNFGDVHNTTAWDNGPPYGALVAPHIDYSGIKPVTGIWNLAKFPALLAAWENSRTTACNNLMVLYAREFARLTSVLVDRSFCNAIAKGGEDIQAVLRQDERNEYYNVMVNCFQLDCGRNEAIRYQFNGINYLNNWVNFIKLYDVKSDEHTATETGFTIAFMRREYANLYHTVNDWYNLFLTMVFFRKRPEETNILLVDAHPKGNLDPVWPVLFNSTRYISALAQRTLFSDMVWGMQGYNSVLKTFFSYRRSPPLLEEFRSFVLDRFQLPTTRQLDCSNISILFVWRRDYLAHPRNPSGLVQRKIVNEDQLLTEMQRRHPNYTIRGVQIDTYSFKDQLKMVSEADVLVGMHGAGLSHTLFVQPHGGTIELVPMYYGADNDHFINLAKWRGLVALRWVNADPKNELKNYLTIIPPDVMDSLLTQVVEQVCSESQQMRLERRTRNNNTEQFEARAASSQMSRLTVYRASMNLPGRRVARRH